MGGVKEYLAVLLREREVRWQRLIGDQCELLPPGPDGIIRPRSFPGLHLAPAALLAGDTAKVLAVLDGGVKTSDHAEFVEHLARRRPD